MSWTKRDRVNAVLSGETADRPPVTAYRHFPGFEYEPGEIARVMVDFQKEYDWDIIKVNSSAVYYYEPWGNRYDYDNYNSSHVPTKLGWAVHNSEELDAVEELKGDAGAFGRQLEALKLIRKNTSQDVPIFQSIYAPIAVLLNLCGDRSPGRYREAPREKCVLLKYFAENRDLVHKALRNISRTLSAYAGLCIGAGADGIFYAEMGLAREGYLSYDEWKEFAMPYDRIVLESLGDKPSILHTCGIYGNPGRFAGYPINGLHWAGSAPRNPPITGSEVWLGKKAAVGGVDERLFGSMMPEGTREIAYRSPVDRISAMARKSVADNRHRPFFLVPECTVDLAAAPGEYRALREAVEG